mmetsp:Transcript_10342/g.35127  ORF Transcript_10342/g.35127 Transcript_10342/m.35127 type:complete len:245 (-) Transcript_10342:105-839(-)
MPSGRRCARGAAPLSSSTGAPRGSGMQHLRAYHNPRPQCQPNSRRRAMSLCRVCAGSTTTASTRRPSPIALAPFPSSSRAATASSPSPGPRGPAASGARWSSLLSSRWAGTSTTRRCSCWTRRGRGALRGGRCRRGWRGRRTRPGRGGLRRREWRIYRQTPWSWAWQQGRLLCAATPMMIARRRHSPSARRYARLTRASRGAPTRRTAWRSSPSSRTAFHASRTSTRGCGRCLSASSPGRGRRG